MRRPILSVALLVAAIPSAASAGRVTVAEVSIDALQAQMTAHRASSVALTRAYLTRIAAMDRKGPALANVIALNPDALAQAKALDPERKAATTAGSLALAGNLTGRDAPLVAAPAR